MICDGALAFTLSLPIPSMMDAYFTSLFGKCNASGEDIVRHVKDGSYDLDDIAGSTESFVLTYINDG